MLQRLPETIREAFASDPGRLEEQLDLLKCGTRYARLKASAGINRGIIALDDERLEASRTRFRRERSQLQLLKFVPASGAASRMFKALVQAWKTGEMNPAADEFISHVELLPLMDGCPESSTIEETWEWMFAREGMDYDGAPKGTIAFHRYPDENRTAFQEHLVEAARYAAQDGVARLHFTIAAEHLESVKSKMAIWTESYASSLGVRYIIDYSIQDPFTDTVALDEQGDIVTYSDGTPLLRPGGHGSLISNLDSLDADIVFIKNVDNVAPDGLKEDTYAYAEALAGVLLEAISESRSLREGPRTESWRAELMAHLRFLGTDIHHPDLLDDDSLVHLLNRPYRVCGMVLNQGEPGGGPFWVEREGMDTLQIVESAQVDIADEGQKRLLTQGSHFNPVNLVCWTKDLDGNERSILPFVDRSTCFVTRKSWQGQDITVLEWPGLWNGAMADWNTVFVEVPISTFSPVKTVNDLLRPEHQASDS